MTGNRVYEAYTFDWRPAMTAILHNAALIYSAAMAALLAITLPFDRRMARFVPARRRRQSSGDETNRPRRPGRW
jgi:hypothetical protein